MALLLKEEKGAKIIHQGKVISFFHVINVVWYFLYLNLKLTNQNLGWNALQRIHGLIAQV